jgi:hypothetical protein
VPGPLYFPSILEILLDRGYHPFDSRRKAQNSSYPINNCGEFDTPHQSEEIVRRRIVQKVGILHWSDWQGLALGKPDMFPLTRCASLRPHTAKDLVSNLLVRDAKRRQTISRAMGHDWITQDLPSLMKVYNKRVEPGTKVCDS